MLLFLCKLILLKTIFDELVLYLKYNHNDRHILDLCPFFINHLIYYKFEPISLIRSSSILVFYIKNFYKTILHLNNLSLLFNLKQKCWLVEYFIDQ